MFAEGVGVYKYDISCKGLGSRSKRPTSQPLRNKAPGSQTGMWIYAVSGTGMRPYVPVADPGLRCLGMDQGLSIGSGEERRDIRCGSGPGAFLGAGLVVSC